MTFSRVLWAGMRPRFLRHATIAATTALALVALALLRPWPGTSSLADGLLFLALATLMYQTYVVAVMVGMLFSVSTELRRKTAHVLGGCVLLLAARMTSSNAVVLALCALLLGWLVATRTLPSLKMYRKLSVDRRDGSESWGDLWFPVGLGAVTVLFGAQSAAWLAAALVLTLADSAAAVIGTRFPGAVFSIAGGTKSFGGSCACWIIAGGSIALVEWMTGSPWSWVACAGLAAIVMGLEAISPRGLDNLSLPLGTAVGVHWIGSVPVLAWIVAVLAGLLVLAGLAVRKKSVPGKFQTEESGFQTK